MIEINLLSLRYVFSTYREVIWRALCAFFLIISLVLFVRYLRLNEELEAAQSLNNQLAQAARSLRTKAPKKHVLHQATLAANVALSHLKFVGFIEHNATCFAFMMLPHGDTVEVHQGAVIGKENLLVRNITPKEVTLQHPDGTVIHRAFG